MSVCHLFPWWSMTAAACDVYRFDGAQFPSLIVCTVGSLNVVHGNASFSLSISGVSAKSGTLDFEPVVALKPLLSLMSRLVAYSSRMNVDRQTNQVP